MPSVHLENVMDMTMFIIIVGIVLGIIILVIIHSEHQNKRERFSTSADPPDMNNVPEFLIYLDDKVNQVRLDSRLQSDKVDQLYTWYQQQTNQQKASASAISSGMQSQLQSAVADPDTNPPDIDIHSMLSNAQNAAASSSTSPSPNADAAQLGSDVAALNIPSVENFYGQRILLYKVFQ
jgi:FtsZ-interacting cell division protein ZipA